MQVPVFEELKGQQEPEDKVEVELILDVLKIL
jgi:hypothetical protein